MFGSPVPLVVWRRGTEQLTGGRFTVLPSGDLEIDDLMMVDAGVYTCTASNKYDTVTAAGSLLVRRRTMIEMAPLNVFVVEGTEAKITCTGSTDLAEMENYRVDWKKDGSWIDYNLAQRVVKNTMDNSLTISGTITLDTGEYTCVASNGLDEEAASASLIVMGVPDPPHSVWVRPLNFHIKLHVAENTYIGYIVKLQFVCCCVCRFCVQMTCVRQRSRGLLAERTTLPYSTSSSSLTPPSPRTSGTRLLRTSPRTSDVWWSPSQPGVTTHSVCWRGTRSVSARRVSPQRTCVGRRRTRLRGTLTM